MTEPEFGYCWFKGPDDGSLEMRCEGTKGVNDRPIWCLVGIYFYFWVGRGAERITLSISPRNLSSAWEMNRLLRRPPSNSAYLAQSYQVRPSSSFPHSLSKPAQSERQTTLSQPFLRTFAGWNCPSNSLPPIPGSQTPGQGGRISFWHRYTVIDGYLLWLVPLFLLPNAFH